MKSNRFLWLLPAAVLCGGCFKSISYDTEYILRPYVQVENQGPITSAPGVRAYAFDADTAGWMVASYADALEGVLTSKRSGAGQVLRPVAVSEPCPPSDTIASSLDWIRMRIDGSSRMIVAVDPQHRLYAYRQQEFQANLSPYYVAVTFRSWRNSYTEGGWRVINEFYIEPEPEPEPDPNPEEPKEPENPGGDPEQPDGSDTPAE